MANDLTGGFDLCLQLAPHAVDTISGAAPSSTGDDVHLRAEALRALVQDRAAASGAFASSAAALHAVRFEAVDGAVAVFANVVDGSPEEAPIPGTESFLGGDGGFGIAASREYVERMVRTEITAASIPCRFEVRAKGSRGAGLVRWDVTVALGSARAVLQAVDPSDPSRDDLSPGVLVVVGGTAMARGIGSLYADLNFTFEVQVPVIPSVCDDRITFSPGEPRFRLRRLAMALEPFRDRIMSSVHEQLRAIRDTVAPITICVNDLASSLWAAEAAPRLEVRSVDVRSGALVVRGRLGAKVGSAHG